MTAATLQVFVPLPASCAPACHVVHVFTVTADKPLEWFKAHADELARQALPGALYDALMVAAKGAA